MSDMMRKVELELAKQEKAKSIETPWWAKAGLKMLSNIPTTEDTLRSQSEYDQASYGREILTNERFDSRLTSVINNSFTDSTIYDNKTIDEIEARLDSIKVEDAKRFPEQSVEFNDLFESKKAQLSRYRDLNEQYNYYKKNIPDYEEFLMGVTTDLSEMKWDELNADKKIELTNKLAKGTEEIAKFARFMEINSDYFKFNKNFANIKYEVDAGLLNGYNQLIKQIAIRDPDGFIINKAELQGMEQTILKKNPSFMQQRNEMIAKAQNSRLVGTQERLNTAYEQLQALELITNSSSYAREEQQVWNAFEEFEKSLKNKNLSEKQKTNEISKYLDNEINWQVRIENAKGELVPVNVLDHKSDVQKLQRSIDLEDANYKLETGNKYTEWMNIPTPWRQTEEQIAAAELKRKADERGMTVDEYQASLKDADKIEPIGQSYVVDDDKEPAGQSVEIYNPGNLKFANQKGATGQDDRGFAIFPSEDAGWQALYNQIEKDKGRNLTLKNFINKYAPEEDNNDTTAYLKNIQKWLNVGKNKKINKIDTKKLANAIAKQEGWGGNFPSIEPPSPTKRKALKDKSVQLTKVNKDGTRSYNVQHADKDTFKEQQANLKDIGSSKFKSLPKEEKKKHGNIKNYVKNKYNEWLEKTGKKGKGAWYSEGDFIYFYPTNVDSKNKINKIKDANLYRLFHPDVFSGATGGVRLNIRPKTRGALKNIFGKKAFPDGKYEQFAKDFDDFRKYLKES